MHTYNYILTDPLTISIDLKTKPKLPLFVLLAEVGEAKAGLISGCSEPT